MLCSFGCSGPKCQRLDIIPTQEPGLLEKWQIPGPHQGKDKVHIVFFWGGKKKTKRHSKGAKSKITEVIPKPPHLLPTQAKFGKI